MRQSIQAFILLLLLTTATGAQFPPSPYAVGFEPTFDDFQIVWHYSDANVFDYGKNLGIPQQYYSVTQTGSVGRVLVEFYGLESFAAVDQILLYLWDSDPFPNDSGGPHSSFVLTIFDHVPTTTQDAGVWGPRIVFAEDVPISGGWFGFTVFRGFVTSGRLYVEFRWQMATPKAPLPAIDWQPGEMRTYKGRSSGTQLDWTPEPRGNLLLQLRCNISDTVPGFERPANLPDSFAIFLGSDSSESATTAEAYFNVSDSLHCALPRTQTQGMYVSLATWDSGVLSKRTAPIYLDPIAPLASPVAIEPESLSLAMTLGDTSSISMVVANKSSRATRSSIHPKSQQLIPWLSWDNAQALILPNESDTIALRINTTGLEAGVHYDTLTIQCETDSFYFRDRVVPIALRVDQATAVDDELLPDFSNLVPEQNYPNPFNSSTIIRSQSPLPITVYNIAGRIVATIVCTERLAAKDYRFNWNGNDQRGLPVASGIYFYHQQGSTSVRKMVILK